MFRLQAAVAVLTLVLLAAPVAGDAPPSLPHYFYGTVKIDSADAPAGTTVEARVPGVLNGSFNPITTIQFGKYGDIVSSADVPRLLVQGNIVDGDTIEFFVNGTKANETAPWHSGSVQRLDLTVGLVLEPLPVPPAVSTSEAGSVTTTSAVLSGNLVSRGTAASVEVSYEWGTVAGGPYASSTVPQVRTGTGAFSTTVSGLSPGTRYYFRARAGGGTHGTGFGAEKSFITAAVPSGGGFGPGPSPPAAPPSPPPVTVGIGGSRSTVTVDERGAFQDDARISSEDGRVKLTVIRGTVALTADRRLVDRISGEVAGSGLGPPPPEDRTILGRVMEFGPAGATFDPPLELVMVYSREELPPRVTETNLVIGYYDGRQWLLLPSTVNNEARTVTARISHFSRFAILAPLPLPEPSPTPPPTPTPSPSPPPSPSPTTTSPPSPPVTPLPSPTPTPSPTETVPPSGPVVTITVTPSPTEPPPTPTLVPSPQAEASGWPAAAGALAGFMAGIGGVALFLFLRRRTRRSRP